MRKLKVVEYHFLYNRNHLKKLFLIHFLQNAPKSASAFRWLHVALHYARRGNDDLDDFHYEYRYGERLKISHRNDHGE